MGACVGMLAAASINADAGLNHDQELGTVLDAVQNQVSSVAAMRSKTVALRVVATRNDC